MIEYTYTVIFEPEQDGGYVVTCPALPMVTTEGDTYEEAREGARAAIERHVQQLREGGQPVPVDVESAAGPLTEQIRVVLDA